MDPYQLINADIENLGSILDGYYERLSEDSSITGKKETIFKHFSKPNNYIW